MYYHSNPQKKKCKQIVFCIYLSNYYKPPLTTIALPLSDIGYTACKMVIDMIEKKERGDSGKTAGSPWEIHEACSLLIRNSVVDLKGTGEKAET